MSESEDHNGDDPGGEQPGKDSRGRRSIARWILDGAVVAGLGLAALWAALFYVFAPELPDTDALIAEQNAPGVVVIAADGRRIAERGTLKGVPIRLEKLPPQLPQAVIATEDRRFYDHFGIDPAGFLRALWVNVRAGEVVQGGSTITQQLAKNLYLSAEQTLLRKIKEAYLAIWLETRLSKDEILELYLNRVYLGAGAYGVEAAAQRYFAKPASRVTLPEAAMLAGLLKAPTYYAPTSDLARAQARAAQVVENMQEAGYLSQAESEAALRNPAELAARPGRGGSDYFVDWLLEELGTKAKVEDRDLVVFSTLDPALQATAEDAIERLLAREGADGGVGQAALVALDHNGAVRAMVGGRNYARSQFNRAANARRQPGSVFKPFVFLAAFENGFTPDSVVEDAPIAIGDWRPGNFNGRYRGHVRLRDALAASLNSVAVRLQERVGRDQVIEAARRLGIESRLAPHASLALGVFESTPLELTAAYAPFANGGRKVAPYGILAVEDEDGALRYRHETAAGQQVIAGRQLEQMNEVLREVMTAGTGRNARPVNGWAAGKSGTTQGYRDGWFVGYTADLVIGVWVGNDDNSPTERVTGGGLPARIWKTVADWDLTRPAAERPVPLPPRRPDAPKDEGLTDRLVAWVVENIFDRAETEGVVGTEDRERWEDAAKDVFDWVLDEVGRAGDGSATPPPQPDR